MTNKSKYILFTLLFGLNVAIYVIGIETHEVSQPTYTVTAGLSSPVSTVVEDINVEEEYEEPVEQLTHWGDGQVMVTAYCSCDKCCGKWAKNRPVDPNTGKQIVYGASGNILTGGISVAAPSTLPFGTELLIDGQKYIVEDRISDWAVEKNGGYVIDIYFDIHGQRLEKDYYDVYIVSK